MSSDATHRSHKKRPDGSRQLSDSAISVTDHARLRFLQRVDGSAPNPNQRLRRIYRTGAAAGHHPDVDQGRARRSGDVIVVYRGTVSSPRIVTVLIDRDGEQR